MEMSDESMSRSEDSESSSPGVSSEPSESEVELHGAGIQSNGAVVEDDADVEPHGSESPSSS
jgi:hypothetical protein